jgi:hypothetical protein
MNASAAEKAAEDRGECVEAPTVQIGTMTQGRPGLRRFTFALGA